MLLLILGVLFMLILLLFIPTTSRVEEDSIQKFKLEVHKYSGLDNTTFVNFMNHIEIFERVVDDSPSVAATHLYKSLEYASTLNLYSPTGEQEHLNDVTNGLAVECERIIMQSALKKGVAFNSKYLKDLYY